MKKWYLLVALLLVTSWAHAAKNVNVDLNQSVVSSCAPVIASVTVFTDGDALGGMNTFDALTRDYQGRVVAHELTITSLISTTATFDVVFYSRTFTPGVNNEAWTPVAGEINDSYLGTTSIAAADWTAVGSGLSTVRKTGLAFDWTTVAASDSVYAQLVMSVGDQSFASNALVLRLKASRVKR